MMKASMKLTIKSKKLKELSKENAQQVGGATLKGGEPQQAAGAHWPTLYSCVC
ncbi:hypothetical protein PSECIP111854_00508 [Pseudoalteromonas sp. CIP111854]|uniref:Uncharacterized protein n=1 Tax=Pseudoalteromonas holothuriae TaxID=2963714 RepID=A0A9W4QRS3_9GAMM|nr:hypothetical protein [Pseudoalteromonas sp. CIP111854]CAH9050328.1 hypothetical protein PSECIP111854_00508 [Pseudoalteromonas sp. CIP111854]